MDTQPINGHHSWRPSGPDAILYQHAQTLGRIEAKVDVMDHRIRKLEDNSMLWLRPIQFIQIGVGITVLGASLTGNVSWAQSIPVLGRLFGGS